MKQPAAPVFVFLVSCLTIALAPRVAEAGASPSVTARVAARLSDDGAILDGRIALDITNDTAEPLEAIPLWLYPNRFADPRRGLDARTVNWLCPRRCGPGSMTVSAASWNGAPLADARLRREPMPADGAPPGLPDAVLLARLPEPLPPGATGTLAMDFTVVIPERRGRFGRSGGTVSLAGDWFPRPFADLGGARPALPPRPIRVRLDLALPGGRGAVIGDRVFPPKNEPRVVSVDQPAVEALPVVVLERMVLSRRAAPWGEIIHVGEGLRPRPRSWKDDRGDDAAGLPRGLPDPATIDYAGRALDVAEDAALILRTLAPDRPLPRRLVLVEIPAWDRLTQAGPGTVLLSDRIWRLIRIEPALAFHDVHLARTVALELVRGGGAGLSWPAAELAAAEVAERFAEEALGEKRSMSDLLGFAGFLPRIDNLLYAPQIPFREVYSPSREEDDPLRDEPWRFMNRTADGRRLHAKLVDRIGEEGTTRLAADLLSGGGNLAALLREHLGDGTLAFINTWSGPYPSVNYRVAGVESEALDGGRVRHVVEVARDGEQAIEPVIVRIEDRAGAVAELVWDGHGERGEVEWISEAPLRRVRVDPEGRLSEDPSLTDGHPLADNIEPLPWRPPLLTRFVIWGDALSGEPHLDLGLALRRRYDISNSFHLSGAHTPRSSGGSFSYFGHFGPRRTLNARTWYAGPVLDVTRYREAERAGPDIPEESRVAATMGGVGATIGRDDRTYFWDPRDGMAFRIFAGYSSGASADGRVLHVGRAAARVFGIVTPAIGHTLAVYGGVTGVAGDPVAADLSSLSNRQVLRAFDVDETYGRLGLYGVVEYRHNLADLSRIPQIMLVRLDRLQGVLFVGAGTISRPAGYGGLFQADRVYTEVGYGLRMHTLGFGVTQNMLALDLGVPITPLDRSYEVVGADGAPATRQRAPFKLVLGISHTY